MIADYYRYATESVPVEKLEQIKNGALQNYNLAEAKAE